MLLEWIIISSHHHYHHIIVSSIKWMALWGENLGLIRGHALPSSQLPACGVRGRTHTRWVWFQDQQGIGFSLDHTSSLLWDSVAQWEAGGNTGWDEYGGGKIRAKQSSQRDRPYLGGLHSRWHQCPQAEWRAPGQTIHWPAYCRHMPAAPAASPPLGGPGVWSWGALAGVQLRTPPPRG